MEVLYRTAHIANVFTGIADPKEYETTALAEVMFYTEFPVAENFIVNSQYPLAPGPTLRCDHAIRYLESGTARICIFDINEAKRTRTNQAFSLKALERQARDYCKIYLESEQDIPFVYASTMAGAHIRLWRYSRDQPELVPFWSSNSIGDWGEYKDIGDNQAGEIIE